MPFRQVVCRIPSACVKAKPKEVKKRNTNYVAVYEPTHCFPVDKSSPALGSAYGVPIRVCRGRLKAACEPPVCNCPDEEQKMGLIDRMKKNWFLLVKAVVVGYAIEETYKIGVWSDADKTALLTKRYMEWAHSYFWTRTHRVRTGIEKYDMRRVTYNMKNVWNNIIMWLNTTLADLPSMITGVLSKADDKNTK